MKKTEILPGFFVQCLPIRSNSFEQPEGADDIGVDKGFRTLNGSVNMAFRGKMYYRSWAVAPKQVAHEGRISDIPPHENVPLVSCNCCQIFRVARITEYIEVDYCLIRLSQPVQYEICPNEPSPA